MTLDGGLAGHELLLSDQRVAPQRLLDDGFVIADRTVQDAVRTLVARAG